MRLTATIESWPIDGEFRIARNAVKAVDLVVVTLEAEGVRGRGECRPYVRYAETPERTRSAILRAWPTLQDCPDRRTCLQETLPAGAARNALDCALWDWQAKRDGLSVASQLGIGAMGPLTTALTISLDTPVQMAAKAADHAAYPLLKLKLGGAGDAERMTAVRAARPDARLIADANEAWTPENLSDMIAAAAAARIEMIEQPLPAGRDAALAGRDWPVPVCADESVHGAEDLSALVDRYRAVNIKLDKTGGLTAALVAVREAERLKLDVMIGCMVATSLAMAPAVLLAHAGAARPRWIDLDGPLLLARDRNPALRYAGPLVFPADTALWG